jgi:hypothetical protein
VSTSTVPPTNQTTSFETQMIPMTPQVLRRTLSAEPVQGFLAGLMGVS